jgi:carbamoyl-phosphate synthase large subunit
MKSVGEAMAIGRTFKESMQKALCSLETGLCGFERVEFEDIDKLKREIKRPNEDRLLYLMQGMREGLSDEDIFELTKIDPWFISQFRDIYDMEVTIKNSGKDILKNKELLRTAKSYGFSDLMIAKLIGSDEDSIYHAKKELQIMLEYNEVDTCSAEFKALTPYLYSTTNITPNSKT